MKSEGFFKCTYCDHLVDSMCVFLQQIYNSIYYSSRNKKYPGDFKSIWIKTQNNYRHQRALKVLCNLTKLQQRDSVIVDTTPDSCCSLSPLSLLHRVSSDSGAWKNVAIPRALPQWHWHSSAASTRGHSKPWGTRCFSQSPPALLKAELTKNASRED